MLKNFGSEGYQFNFECGCIVRSSQLRTKVSPVRTFVFFPRQDRTWLDFLIQSLELHQVKVLEVCMQDIGTDCQRCWRRSRREETDERKNKTAKGDKRFLHVQQLTLGSNKSSLFNMLRIQHLHITNMSSDEAKQNMR